MTLDEVIATLDTTIQGKQQMLTEFSKAVPVSDPVRNMVLTATCEFLRINLTELNNIREHLLLVKQTTAKDQNQAQEDSWRANPDRMGGAYTSEEIAESRGWR